MRLELIALDKSWASRNAAESTAVLEGLCANYATVAPYVEDAVDALIAIYARTPDAAPWTAYLVRSEPHHDLVGICSLTDDGNGVMALGYHTFPPYEGQGLAKAMVDELVALAWARPGTSEIVSHTPPNECPAASVLRGRNFRCVNAVNNLRHGLRWHWSLGREQHAAWDSTQLYVPMVRTGIWGAIIAAPHVR